MNIDSSWKTKTLIIGSVIGAATGFLGAFLLVKRAEEANEPPKLTAGEGVQLGLGVLGLMRLISDPGRKKK